MEIKESVRQSFWQLFILYTLFVLLVAVNVFSRYRWYFNVLGVITGLLAIFTLDKTIEVPLKTRNISLIVIISILFLIAVRSIPLIKHNVPLGYDAGIYRYGIEHGLANRDNWILQGGLEPGFLYLMQMLKLIWNSDMLLTWVYIFFTALLGLLIYATTKEYFGKHAGMWAVLWYSVSIAQFSMYSYLYYKNVLGLCLALAAMIYINKAQSSRINWIPAVLLGGLTGAVHRPTFYLFGIAYATFALSKPYQLSFRKYNYHILGKYVFAGSCMLVITLLFYIGDFWPAITSGLGGVAGGFIQPGVSPGTFMTFREYQFASLAVLPLAILGLGIQIKRKQWNLPLAFLLMAALIVYFQFFFFQRYIIYLDLALSMAAGVGTSSLISSKKAGAVLIVLLILSSGYLVVKQSSQSKPIITEQGIDLLKKFAAESEENSRLMVLTSEYSPYALGWSGREVIAPGLFDSNKWTEEEWRVFWLANNTETTIKLLLVYQPSSSPFYLFAGTKEWDNPCFEESFRSGQYHIERYICS